MIYTKVNNKEHLRMILTVLSAMGFTIGQNRTVDKYMELYGESDIRRVGLVGDHIDTWNYEDRNTLSWPEFLKAMALEIQVKKIRLNFEYTAVIYPEETKVGCQTFPNSKILEVADAIRKLS